ncbi:MAG: LPS export ABC transporter periplasmic protein LptC [Alphaproteobacteria bacterium]
MSELSDNDARMERLSRRGDKVDGGGGYTRFVRAMRFALPLAAIGVVVVLYFRSGVEETAIIPLAEREIAQDIKEQRISKNELMNPKFESMDKKSQPYEITADRAVQGESNKDLIMLERPIGRMTMQDGDVIKVTSQTGAYRQDTERFFLEGDVFLEHVQGYTLETAEAHIDMKQNFAWSEKDVHASGPDLSIDAKGIQANGQTGEIVFQGPAKLILDKGFEGGK